MSWWIRTGSLNGLAQLAKVEGIAKKAPTAQQVALSKQHAYDAALQAFGGRPDFVRKSDLTRRIIEAGDIDPWRIKV